MFQHTWLCGNDALVSSYQEYISTKQSYFGALWPDWNILHQLINKGINTPLNDVCVQSH